MRADIAPPPPTSGPPTHSNTNPAGIIHPNPRHSDLRSVIKTVPAATARMTATARGPLNWTGRPKYFRSK
jgi:hypothetical protein